MSGVQFDPSQIINTVITCLSAFGAMAVFYFGLRGDVRSNTERQEEIISDLHTMKEETAKRIDGLSEQIRDIGTRYNSIESKSAIFEVQIRDIQNKLDTLHRNVHDLRGEFTKVILSKLGV